MQTLLYIVLSVTLTSLSLFYSRSVAEIEPLESKCYETKTSISCAHIRRALGSPFPFVFHDGRYNIKKLKNVQIPSILLNFGFYWCLLFFSNYLIRAYVRTNFADNLKYKNIGKMLIIFLICFLLAFIANIASIGSQGGLGDEVYLSLDACTGLDNKQLHWSCFHPVISGGFPFAYIFDSLGVSITHSIFIEDTFRYFPFILNMWIYFLMFFALFIPKRESKGSYMDIWADRKNQQ